MRALVVVALLGGCFNPKPQEGFACFGADQWCPEPLRCANDGTCRSADVIGDGGGGNDDAVVIGDANIAFVTSQKFAPVVDLGNIADADNTCAEIGKAKGHAGKYVAWISSLTDAVTDRIGSAGGWRRLDGKAFAATKEDLIAGHILFPLSRDESGNELIDVVMSGTGLGGTGGTQEDCQGLSSNSAGDQMIQGFTDGDSTLFTAGTDSTCDTTFHMYCLQTETNTVVSISPTTLPKAFLSTPFTPNGGIAAANQHCQNDANAIPLGGTFVALLATTNQAATDPITISVPFVRVDGVEVTQNFALLESPISVTADGQHIAEEVWAGALTPSTQSASQNESCNDWTSTSGSARTGQSGRAVLGVAFGGQSNSCAIARRMYCVEKR